MGGGGWMDDQCFRVAYVGKVADQFQAIDKLIGGGSPTFDVKRQNTAKTILQVFFCQYMIRACL